MNVQILSELELISSLLIGLIIIASLWTFIFIVRTTMEYKFRRNSFDLGMRDNLIAQAQVAESKGDYALFLETSEELIEMYPEDLMANWYFALSNYKTNHLGVALSALGRIKELDPAWSKETVDDYIETIRSEMKGPKSV